MFSGRKIIAIIGRLCHEDVMHLRTLQMTLSLAVLTAWSFSLQAEERLQVVASIAPLASIAQQVAGDAAEVKVLLPPGTGPHDFALSPADLKTINSADLILMNGLGLDDWLGKAVRSGQGTGNRLVVLAEGLGTVERARHAREEGHAHDGHGHAHQEGVNPHVWLNPIHAIEMTRRTAAALVKRDTVNAGTYRRNAEAFVQKLEALDQELAESLKPYAGAPLITFHDAFPHFAERYGLRVVAVFEEFPGKEPSPKYLRRLREVIKKENVRVLFAEPQFSSRMMRSIASDLDVEIATMDPMDTGDPAPDLYERVMRANLKALLSAFHGRH
jgi:zinc transport system substrate-binding protein